MATLLFRRKTGTAVLQKLYIDRSALACYNIMSFYRFIIAGVIMWISDRWEDYELLDASGGEKLERWGDKLLLRPDPQAIWETPRTDPRWHRPDASYKRSASGGGAWEKNNLPASWVIRYGGLRFQVKPMSFKHTGIFPEQAANWDWAGDMIRGAGRSVRVLNLFAYTGAATAACLAAGAEVCHVDAAKGMVAWAKENAACSGVADRPVRWIVDDCVKFCQREIRRGRRYDAVIMDPPSYGRGPGGEVWRLEDNLWGLVTTVAELLSEQPLFVLINSYTTGLSPSVLTYISESVFTKKYHGHGQSDAQELGLRAAASGLVLPCGAACRWVFTS